MSKDLQKFSDRIRQLIPISELPQHAQNEVVNNAVLLKVRKGGTVFKQGDRDDFSFYVLDGEVELHANNQLHSVVAANTDRARYAMAQLQPRQFTAKARTAAQVMQVRRDYLDKLMVLHAKDDNKTDITNYDLATAEVEVDEIDGEDDAMDWMTRMLQSELFMRMPTSNIHALFAKLEPITFNVEDVVIKQGESGQHYFIIQEGRCEVTRKPASGGKDIKLAELKPGDGFGEEALISDTTRNATVSMLSDGVLMRLSKDDFIDLIKKPTLRSVSLDTARQMVTDGAVWIDVRFKNEFDSGAIPGALHIPLNILRMQADKLDRSRKYIVYCDTSGRSSTAAFLLAGRGFDVCYLEGGIVNNSDVLPRTAESAPEAAPKPAPKPAPEPEPDFAIPEDDGDAIDTISRQDIDPEVKASVLETELARTNIQLKNVEKQKNDSGDVDKEAARAAVERKLQEERAKIESAKKAAEEEAKKLRQREEERIGKMKRDAELRLQEEKKKLEEVYSKNAEEMERLQRLKQEADEQMRKDRERLEQESMEAKKKLEEAQKIKKEIEASKRAMEKEGLRRRKEQEEMEKRIQKQAREQLQVERRKLAEQFSRNNEELEKARVERQAADAARDAARAEAESIIAEYKTKHEKAQAEQEERLREERRKLEEEQHKIQEMLKEIQKAKHDAESAKKAALEEIEALRAKKSDVEITQSKVAKATIEEDLRVAEERLNQADENMAKVELAEHEMSEASKLNEEDIERKRAEEAELKKQLDADLEGFKEELEEQEKKFSSVSSQLEHMRRIKQRAEAAKNAAKNANENLLSDVANQLGKEKP